MGSTDWVLGSCCHHYPHALCRQVKPGDHEGVTHIFDSLAVESKSTQVAPLLQLCWQRWSTQTLALGWQTTGPPNALLDRKTRQKGFLWWQMQVHNNTPSKAPHTIANWFKQEEQAYHHNTGEQTTMTKDDQEYRLWWILSQVPMYCLLHWHSNICPTDKHATNSILSDSHHPPPEVSVKLWSLT